MIKYSKYSILCITAVFFLAGCKAGTSYEPIVTVAPPTQAVEQSDFSDDQLLVLATIVDRMRGRETPKNVVFDPNYHHVLSEPHFKYEGMKLVKTIIFDMAVTPLDDSKRYTRMAGAFLFKDELDRRAGARFAVQFVTTTKGVIISTSAVTETAVDFPRVEAYIVPQKAFDEEKVVLDDYVSLYQAVLQNAVPMNYDAEGDMPDVDRTEQLIFVFCKDRLAPGAEFKAKMVTPKTQPLYANMQGWPIAVFGAKFKPGNQRERIDLLVTYNPAPDADGTTITIGRFDNKMHPMESAAK